MTSKEHALMIFMLTRQAMLIKSLADILKNNGLMTGDDMAAFDSVVSQEEMAHLPILRKTTNLYIDLAKTFGVDTGVERA